MITWMHSKLCRDIQVATGIAFLGFIGLGTFVLYSAREPVPVVGVLTTAFFTLFVFLWNAGNTRMGVATVFDSEIRNICNVMWTFDLASLTQESVIANWLQLKQRMTAREEDYVETFSRNIDKIATLPNGIVFEITAFFTFLKASRDAVLVLHCWEEATLPAQKIEDVKRIANHLHNCLVRARAAIQQLGDGLMDHDTERIDKMIASLKKFLGKDLVKLDERPS